MRKDGITVMADHRTEPRCFREDGEIVFCGYFPSERGCGIAFYDASGKDRLAVSLPEDTRTGRLYSVKIKGVPDRFDRYRLIDRKKEFVDPGAFRIIGLEKMETIPDEKKVYASILTKPPLSFLQMTRASRLHVRTQPEEDFIYLLHVRGFTKSASAGVPKQHRGTFAGVIDKLDYISSLGATAVELMPAYEEVAAEEIEPSLLLHNDLNEDVEEKEYRINYWGYKQGFYLAPRRAYSASEDPCREFHELADALHKHHLALILQFWFPQHYPTAILNAVLRHWVRFYGVDGFHLIGGGLPAETVACDPALAGIKIYYESIDPDRLQKSEADQNEAGRTVSVYNGEFSHAVRRFIKGDDHSIGAFFGAMIRHHDAYGTVNYLSNYDGFRLIDSVSYEHKHNEANRENNADGTTVNNSWNCGVEGPTRKLSIQRLRRRQIFNMLTMLFFAQGTPMLCAGDEFLHTQEGNNNPYCQDNAISWINWRGESTAMGEATQSFLRFLASYRKKHRMLSLAGPLKMMDYKAYGFPDLSAHGTDAWQPDFSGFSHSVGMLYCNLYAKEQDPAFLYCIYNCHWEAKRFALPSVPKPLSWTVVIDTGKTGVETEERSLSGEKTVLLAARSVMVLEARGRFRFSKQEERTPF